MKILITGGSGFIGTHLIDALSSDHELINFDKNISKEYPQKTIIGDVRDAASLKEVVKGVDTVIHLAAEHKDNVSPISLYYDVNVGGTKNLVDACENGQVKRIIFTSTVAVYGLQLNNSHEDSNLAPFNDYGKSKLQAEKVLGEWYEKKEGRSLSIVRPTVVFGERNRGNVYNLIKQVAENRFVMVGSGNNKKSIAYVSNLVSYMTVALEDKGLSITNYADKPDLSMRQLILAVNEALGKSERKLSIPYWFGLSVGYALDLISILLKKKFTISSIRIRKFCSNSTINTDRLEGYGMENLIPLSTAIEKTTKYEFEDSSGN